ISHVEVAINTVTNTPSVRLAELVTTSEYDDLDDDPIVESLLEKYEDQISIANQVVGFNGKRRSGDEMRQLVADMYYQAGIERWGQEYDIVLGGGFISVRSPGYLAYGDVTYGMLQALFPFDNQLTLCSVKGRDLWKKFLNTDNDNYFISYGDYGAEVYNNIDMNATYYIITDTYSAYYASNKLTVVAEYDAGVYARDLLADYMTAGGLE
ncbi:MAG: 5'-nucleotidase C-terminal domain-containing protein, partial [Oscillospiraceae bacterium]|nr:5'-nucleotidase C-terminal domain-containing protein [Oscillospiraceae bacterium]